MPQRKDPSIVWAEYHIKVNSCTIVENNIQVRCILQFQRRNLMLSLVLLWKLEAFFLSSAFSSHRHKEAKAGKKTDLSVDTLVERTEQSKECTLVNKIIYTINPDKQMTSTWIICISFRSLCSFFVFSQIQRFYYFKVTYDLISHELELLHEKQ